LISFVGGRRDERLIRELMESTRDRLKDPRELVLMSDGARSYESLFASIFGQPYRPARKGDRGRFPKLRHRINRELAHLQVIKHRRRGKVVEVSPTGGAWLLQTSQPRVGEALLQQGQPLGHRTSEWHFEEDERLFGQKEPCLCQKRGKPGSSWMVLYSGLQLLPPTKGTKGAVIKQLRGP
jgi:hypothetical protein